MLQLVLFGLGTAGTILGVTTLIIVLRVMTDFHAELMQKADAVRDPALLDAIARDFRTMILMLASDRAGGGP